MLFNYLVLSFSFILLIGCGQNASILKLREISNQALTPDQLEFQSFVGTAAMGLNGYDDSGFSDALSSSPDSKVVDDFSSYVLGSSLELIGFKDGISYSIKHFDDDGGLGIVDRNLYVENPVSQDRAAGFEHGIDFSYGALTNRNMMVVTFDQPMGHFGVDLIDFESHQDFTLGEMRVYSCADDPELLLVMDIDFNDEDGNEEVHFLGLTATEAVICHIAIVVGDDSPGEGKSERFAIDNLRFGLATSE